MKETTTQHTPTPYRVGTFYGRKANELWIHSEGKTSPVFYIASHNRKEQALIDGHFIVRACNSHDELVKVLEAARRVIKSPEHFDHNYHYLLDGEIEQALSHAKDD